MIYNRTLPNLKEAVKKHWNILQINNVNNEFIHVFSELQIICFCRNENLKDIIRTKTIINNKAQKLKSSNRKGYSIAFHSKPGTCLVET